MVSDLTTNANEFLTSEAILRGRSPGESVPERTNVRKTIVMWNHFSGLLQKNFQKTDILADTRWTSRSRRVVRFEDRLREVTFLPPHIGEIRDEHVLPMCPY